MYAGSANPSRDAGETQSAVRSMGSTYILRLRWITRSAG
jgi:hypothetical protein